MLNCQVKATESWGDTKDLQDSVRNKYHKQDYWKEFKTTSFFLIKHWYSIHSASHIAFCCQKHPPPWLTVNCPKFKIRNLSDNCTQDGKFSITNEQMYFWQTTLPETKKTCKINYTMLSTLSWLSSSVTTRLRSLQIASQAQGKEARCAGIWGCKEPERALSDYPIPPTTPPVEGDPLSHAKEYIWSMAKLRGYLQKVGCI